MPAPALRWLPAPSDDWDRDCKRLAGIAPADAWDGLVTLANQRLDFLRTQRLDATFARLFAAPPADLPTRPVRLAVLGSSTVTHLLPGIRVGALRRGLWVTIYEAGYGQYLQELLDPRSGLHAFRPTTILLALDAHHLLAGARADCHAAAADALLDDRIDLITRCWQLARDAFGCTILQQTIMPVFPALLGNNEQRLPGSAAHLVDRLNMRLREEAGAHAIDLLALDRRCLEDGRAHWHNAVLWHRAKQEVSPLAAPFYGDLVGRLLGALHGRSRKALVLDLDNTLWGGVIGEDGMHGIAIGPGSALGEAFAAFQCYARDLARRGIVLAVCSKNDHEDAIEPFRSHPEMVLREADCAAFVANWDDKPSNLRRIAEALNLGLEALVFVDDNPYERHRVRAELPMVAVPELTEEPAEFARMLADAGYFESTAVTMDDRQRQLHYRQNQARDARRAQSTDLAFYLRGLDMRLSAKRFDRADLPRIVQLINKTNQFNLTTHRYSEADVVAIMDDPQSLACSLRLLDCFGDNGIVAIVILRPLPDGDIMLIDTWLMSCRVLGRGVEDATLNLIVAEASRRGARRLIGEYRPTAKNAMVREHYAGMGFTMEHPDADTVTRSWLDLRRFEARATCIRVTEVETVVA